MSRDDAEFRARLGLLPNRVHDTPLVGPIELHANLLMIPDRDQLWLWARREASSASRERGIAGIRYEFDMCFTPSRAAPHNVRNATARRERSEFLCCHVLLSSCLFARSLC